MKIKILRHTKEIFKKYAGRYFIGIAILAAVDILQITIPKITASIIDALRNQEATYSFITQNFIKICTIILTITILRFFWRFFIWGTARFVERDIREKLFEKFMYLSTDFHNKNKTGDLMSHATNDIDAIRGAVGDGVLMISDFVILTIFTLIAMFNYSMNLTLFSLIPLSLIALMVTISGPVVHKRFKKVQESFSRLSDLSQESFSGIRVIKAFTQEENVLSKFKNRSSDLFFKNLNLVKIWGVFFPLIEFLGGASMFILLLYGGSLVINQELSLGSLVAFTTYIGMLIWPMLALGWAINLFQRGSVSLERLNEIFDKESSVKNPEKAISIDFSKIKGSIEFKGVSFTYESNKEKYALNNVNIKINANKRIGIIGPIGSGKTTFVNLITRLYDPVKGEILIDGINIKRFPLKTLRHLIGFTPQDVFLFSDKIKANIDIQDMGHSHKYIKEVTSASSIYTNIEDFKEGFDTIVGERGVTLSGGEKQRITISRALAKNPKILILDDVLSAVDANTEKIILRNLQRYIKERTTLVISNRVAALKNMDLILVFNRGEIEEMGTHKELIGKKGLYYKIYKKQVLEEKIRKEEEYV